MIQPTSGPSISCEHILQAFALAVKLNVPAENVLGLGAEESACGTSSVARNASDYLDSTREQAAAREPTRLKEPPYQASQRQPGSQVREKRSQMISAPW